MESFKTFYCLVLCLLASFRPIYCGNIYKMSIVDSFDYELIGDPHTYKCQPNVVLFCKYTNDDVLGKFVQWLHFTNNGGIETVGDPKEVGKDFSEGRLPLTISSSGHYACELKGVPLSRITITITFQNGIRGCQDANPSVTSTSRVTTSTHVITPTSVALVTTITVSSTPRTYSNTSHFVGLNPLIYTTITAVLLVVLTLVAIVTCWLRSRKMSPQRTLLPQETPQDYLDYIREGQFTPLTTSEFLASLHERPPTYIESQDIQRRMENDDDETPPPLPLRNMTRREATSPTASNESRNVTPTLQESTTPTSQVPASSPEPLVVQNVTLQEPLVNTSTSEPLLDSSQDLSIDTTIQDPLAPLLDPIFLQDPITQSDEQNIDDIHVDENAPLIINL